MQLFQKSSIKNKITLLMVFTSVVVLTIATMSFMLFQVFSISKASLQELSTLAKTIGINSRAPLTFNDRTSALETLSALSAVPDVTTQPLSLLPMEVRLPVTEPISRKSLCLKKITLLKQIFPE